MPRPLQLVVHTSMVRASPFDGRHISHPPIMKAAPDKGFLRTPPPPRSNNKSWEGTKDGQKEEKKGVRKITFRANVKRGKNGQN